MSDHPLSKVLEALRSVTGFDPRRSGKSWTARCPAHDDKRPSLSVSEGDEGRALVRCHAGCEVDSIVSALGLTLEDLMPERVRSPRKRAAGGDNRRSVDGHTFPTAAAAVAALEQTHSKRSACWTYENAAGDPVSVVVRWNTPEGKTIRPVRRTSAGWIIGAMPEPRPLYALPALRDADSRVFIVEGEKFAEVLRSIRLTATTSAGGSQAAAKTAWQPLAGRECIILPDHDKAGRRYADGVVRLLSRLSPAPAVKIVELRGLRPGGDVVDHVAARQAAAASDDAIRGEIEALADAAEPMRPAAAPEGGPEPVLIRMADVKPESIRWLWPGRIALGKLTLLAGDPGLGKSLITLDMSARVSTGTCWPDCRGTENPAGGVVLLSAEDDIADTIRPRLDAAGADVSRIVMIQGVKRRDADTGAETAEMFSLVTDVLALERAIQQTDHCRLAIIDPITAYLGRTDSHVNAEVRGLLAPLSELARRCGVAVVAVTHLNKASTMPAVYRAMGSLAFVAAARAVWAVTKDKDDPTERRRLFIPVKNNLGNDRTGLAYRVEQAEDESVYVAWEPEPIRVSADDALGERGQDGEHGDREQAGEWLHDALADGPLPSIDVIVQAKGNGISEKTLRRAFHDMGGKPRKGSFGGGWYWGLPGQDGQAEPEDSQDALSNGKGIFEEAGHLGPGGSGEEWGECDDVDG